MLIFFLGYIRQEPTYGAVGPSWKTNVTYRITFITVSLVRNTACFQGSYMNYGDAKLQQFSNQQLGVKAFMKEMKQ